MGCSRAWCLVACLIVSWLGVARAAPPPKRSVVFAARPVISARTGAASLEMIYSAVVAGLRDATEGPRTADVKPMADVVLTDKLVQDEHSKVNAVVLFENYTDVTL